MIQPTCTEGGKSIYKCIRCDDSYESDWTSANGHTEAAAVQENRVEATMSAAGRYDSVVYCAVCRAELSRERVAIPVLEATVNGYNLTTASDVLVNSYIGVPEDAVTADPAMYITLNDGDPIKLSEITGTPNAQGIYKTASGYKFPQRTPAKNMHDTVTLKLYDGSGNPLQLTASDGTKVDKVVYSVQNYLDQVISDYESDQDAHGGVSTELYELCQAMSDYGSLAQQHKNYQTSTAEGILHPDWIDAVKADELTSAIGIQGESDVLTFYGGSLIMESEMVLRFYVRYTGSGTLTVNGEALERYDSSNYYFYDLTNVLATNFDGAHEIVITDGTNTLTLTGFSVHAYAKQVLQTSADGTLCNLVRAIVVYGQKAVAYYNSLHS